MPDPTPVLQCRIVAQSPALEQAPAEDRQLYHGTVPIQPPSPAMALLLAGGARVEGSLEQFRDELLDFERYVTHLLMMSGVAHKRQFRGKDKFLRRDFASQSARKLWRSLKGNKRDRDFEPLDITLKTDDGEQLVRQLQPDELHAREPLIEIYYRQLELTCAVFGTFAPSEQPPYANPQAWAYAIWQQILSDPPRHGGELQGKRKTADALRDNARTIRNGGTPHQGELPPLAQAIERAQAAAPYDPTCHDALYFLGRAMQLQARWHELGLGPSQHLRDPKSGKLYRPHARGGNYREDPTVWLDYHPRSPK